jgi:hypothetical protein
MTVNYQKIASIEISGITTAEAVYPGKFVKFVRGRLLIHEWAGFSSFVPDPMGNHRIGLSMIDKTAFLDFFGNALIPHFIDYEKLETTTELTLDQRNGFWGLPNAYKLKRYDVMKLLLTKFNIYFYVVERVWENVKKDRDSEAISVFYEGFFIFW